MFCHRLTKFKQAKVSLCYGTGHLFSTSWSARLANHLFCVLTLNSRIAYSLFITFLFHGALLKPQDQGTQAQPRADAFFDHQPCPTPVFLTITIVCLQCMDTHCAPFSNSCGSCHSVRKRHISVLILTLNFINYPNLPRLFILRLIS